MAGNTLKLDFAAQWGGSGAFVAKNSDATLLYELVHKWHQFNWFCTEVRAATK
jgi:hypothetical protein